MDVRNVLDALDAALNAAEDVIVRDKAVEEGTTFSMNATALGDGHYSMFATVHYPDGSYDTVSRGWNCEGAPF